MDPTLVGLAGFAALFFLIFAVGMPIGFSMALVGFVGISLISGLSAAWGSLGVVPYSTVATSTMSVIPMFILMGNFAVRSGIMTDVYTALNKWVGHLPGGLAISTVGGCAGFAACSGSSVACAAVMVPTAWPEMKKYKYDPALALGTIAAGGTLGIMIPPSTPFVVYGMLSEQSIGKLLIAGILPGILLGLMFAATIYILVRVKPELGPPAARASWRDRFTSLRGVWPMLLLALVVMGGIWLGICTAEEAGAIGAVAALLIAIGRKSISRDQMLESLLSTARATAMIFTIMIGAMILNRFLAITKLPFLLSEVVSGLPLPPLAILACVLLLYVVLGMLMDPLGMVLLTVPILLPTLAHLGIDLIWFGVLLTAMTELALITPPIGVNVFFISGMAKEVPMYTVFRGIAPFALAMAIGIAMLVSFPQISLLLPNTMRGG